MGQRAFGAARSHRGAQHLVVRTPEGRPRRQVADVAVGVADQHGGRPERGAQLVAQREVGLGTETDEGERPEPGHRHRAGRIGRRHLGTGQLRRLQRRPRGPDRHEIPAAFRCRECGGQRGSRKRRFRLRVERHGRRAGPQCGSADAERRLPQYPHDGVRDEPAEPLAFGRRLLPPVRPRAHVTSGAGGDHGPAAGPGGDGPPDGTGKIGAHAAVRGVEHGRVHRQHDDDTRAPDRQHVHRHRPAGPRPRALPAHPAHGHPAQLDAGRPLRRRCPGRGIGGGPRDGSEPRRRRRRPARCAPRLRAGVRVRRRQPHRPRDGRGHRGGQIDVDAR